MVFNSYLFILFFLPISVIGYYLFNSRGKYRLGLCFLTGMSLWFYGSFNIVYLGLLLISVGINYLIITGLFRVAGVKLRRVLFVGALLFNIGLLCYFKYYNFFIESLNQALQEDYALHELFIPVAISFYTFQQIAYVVDCYHQKRSKDLFLLYLSYMTFFPKITQGPITFPEDLIGQFEAKEKKAVCYTNLTKGMYSFALGLSKKVLLADTLAKFANAGFKDVASLDSTNAMIAMLCYALQIYFDFSGYCDMANGVAYLFNIELPINFNSPYKASSIVEFWDRWHMTLTRFFTRYLYIPLGGNRKGTVRTYVNTMIVFLISGLWHGANWTFVLWGALHGLLLVMNKLFKKLTDKIPKVIGIASTFVVVVLLWTIFRADTITQAFSMIKTALYGQFGTISPIYTQIMNELIEIRILCRFGLQSVVDSMPAIPILLFLLTMLWAVFFPKNTQQKLQQFQMNYRKLMLTVILLTWSIFSLAEISQFVYFSF